MANLRQNHPLRNKLTTTSTQEHQRENNFSGNKIKRENEPTIQTVLPNIVEIIPAKRETERESDFILAREKPQSSKHQQHNEDRVVPISQLNNKNPSEPNKNLLSLNQKQNIKILDQQSTQTPQETIPPKPDTSQFESRQSAGSEFILPNQSHNSRHQDATVESRVVETGPLTGFLSSEIEDEPTTNKEEGPTKRTIPDSSSFIQTNAQNPANQILVTDISVNARQDEPKLHRNSPHSPLDILQAITLGEKNANLGGEGRQESFVLNIDDNQGQNQPDQVNLVNLNQHLENPQINYQPPNSRPVVDIQEFHAGNLNTRDESKPSNNQFSVSSDSPKFILHNSQPQNIPIQNFVLEPNEPPQPALLENYSSPTKNSFLQPTENDYLTITNTDESSGVTRDFLHPTAKSLPIANTDGLSNVNKDFSKVVSMNDQFNILFNSKNFNDNVQIIQPNRLREAPEEPLPVVNFIPTIASNAQQHNHLNTQSVLVPGPLDTNPWKPLQEDSRAFVTDFPSNYQTFQSDVFNSERQSLGAPPQEIKVVQTSSPEIRGNLGFGGSFKPGLGVPPQEIKVAPPSPPEIQGKLGFEKSFKSGFALPLPEFPSDPWKDFDHSGGLHKIASDFPSESTNPKDALLQRANQDESAHLSSIFNTQISEPDLQLDKLSNLEDNIHQQIRNQGISFLQYNLDENKENKKFGSGYLIPQRKFPSFPENFPKVNEHGFPQSGLYTPNVNPHRNQKVVKNDLELRFNNLVNTNSQDTQIYNEHQQPISSQRVNFEGIQIQPEHNVENNLDLQNYNPTEVQSHIEHQGLSQPGNYQGGIIQQNPNVNNLNFQDQNPAEIHSHTSHQEFSQGGNFGGNAPGQSNPHSTQGIAAHLNVEQVQNYNAPINFKHPHQNNQGPFIQVRPQPPRILKSERIQHRLNNVGVNIPIR